VAVKVLVPTLRGTPSISRVVEVNPLGPVQLQDPPVKGWGPRFTVAGSEAAVTALACVHDPPFSWR
jgi:hypothetical protein